MKKIFKRLIVFFIGIPLVFSMIMFFPQKNHLLLNSLVVIFTVLAAVEFRNMLARKNLPVSLIEAIILGLISPGAWTLVVSFGFNMNIIPGAFVLGAAWVLVSQVLIHHRDLDNGLNRIVAGFAVMVYPGFFMANMIRISAFPRAGIIIISFLLMVFLNDSLAWLSGILFGKSSRGLVAASPNKSLVGFIVGQVFSVLTGIAAVCIFSDIFSPDVFSPLASGILLGFGTGLACIFGDLSESALKRSSGVKDSGTLILGRGGALDSIDSLALAAPVFYMLCRLLFSL